MATHYDIVHLSEVGSTQDEAARRFDATRVPTLVVADRQVDGRGRQGRTWEQPDRAVFSSISFSTGWEPVHRTLIPLIAGLVACEVISEVGPREPSLKWPNDILIDGAKAGGVLVEANGDRLTVGCGLNLWWADPIAGATSVFHKDVGSEVALNLATRWAQALIGDISRPSGDWRKDQYVERSATLGSEVAWDDGTGTAIGLSAAGALVVDTVGGLKTIHAGDVHLRPPR